jgi:predicted transcriptional regulator
MLAKEMEMSQEHASNIQLELAADIVSAYVSNNPVPAATLPDFIQTVHASLAALGRDAATAEPAMETKAPAVPLRKSITNEYIVCLEDGKKFKSLKRHLQAGYGMTPAEYRAKWGLPPDYPMVAPAYTAARSAMAKKMGLGRKPAAVPAARRGRKKAA